MINKKVLISAIVAALIFSTSSIAEEKTSEGETMFQALGCWGCHGQGGYSSDERYPTLAGKGADWIVQQLEDFQSGKRQSSMMNSMAPMAEGFERVIAEYLAGQPVKD